MEHIPWFAWIAIVGIVVWGMVAAVGSITGRPHQARRGECDHEDVEQLKRRIEQLEAQLYRGA
ncbi:hypothetical protein GCM10023190_23460 [Enteractinococcus fodinae]|uniref:Uncharacterized protein n=1 Tax=Enteractinococcus fodinae TaxID=684663 RepID=A0ABU2B2R7_9MICC|nr:hypothetical protein [Enteractinococcus fodinae]MDR7347892.1 hypothetical protein [Enteractinococcus fodinae]